MEDRDTESRLAELEQRIDRLISVAGTGVGLGAAALVLEIAIKDWGLSRTTGGVLGGVAFFAAFIWLVMDIKRPQK